MIRHECLETSNEICFFGANVQGVGFRGPVLPPKTMVWLVICRPGHSLRGQDVTVKIQL